MADGIRGFHDGPSFVLIAPLEHEPVAAANPHGILSRGFVDFAGRIAAVVDANTGELIPVQIDLCCRPTVADSGEVARSFRDHVARCSDMMSPA
jgi:hypothetical protein